MTGAGGTSPFAALQEAMTDAPSAVSGGGGGGPAPSSGSDYKLSRVETNQRALIDKILARYATQNAVFRELLQNSNDAGAKTAEIRYTTDVAATAAAAAAAAAEGGAAVRLSRLSLQPRVTRVLYRNDGEPFREQDWARLSKIAEGNPDPSKVGAFGVGAYTMFSVAEEPLVVSAGKVLMFVWKGDALWTRAGPVPPELEERLEDPERKWTTFVLDSRDLYPVPKMVELGRFLASSLTFTKSLHTVRVYVDDRLEMTLSKERIREPEEIQVGSKGKGWTKLLKGTGKGGETSSSSGIFTLGGGLGRGFSTSSGGGGGGGIMESVSRLTVTVADYSSSVDARYISAPVSVRMPKDMARKMERVTKKSVPSQLSVEVFLGAGASKATGSGGGGRGAEVASAITDAFAPGTGTGKIFIGFQTSQTTGLAAHVAAPFVPTVEREAIDLVDPTLRRYNSELLEISGMTLRLGLERGMQSISERYETNMDIYLAEDRMLITNARLKRKAAEGQEINTGEEGRDADDPSVAGDDATVGKSLLGFAKYMAFGVKSMAATAAKTVNEIVANDEETELLRPLDPRPISPEEQDAILLMKSFCARPSTPDADIGISIAGGFTRIMGEISPPVLTRTGVVRGDYARLPREGIEAYVEENVVRRVVLENAQEYHEVIAQCRPLNIRYLVDVLHEGIELDSIDDVARFIKWWIKYNRSHPSYQFGPLVKRLVRFYEDNVSKNPRQLDLIYYYLDGILLSEEGLPMPDSVIRRSIQDAVGSKNLSDVALRSWFAPLPVDIWATYIGDHSIMTDGLASDMDIRALVLSTLSKELKKQQRFGAVEGSQFAALVRNLLHDKKCIPVEHAHPVDGALTDFPSELYLSSANLTAFAGLHSFRKVSPNMNAIGVSDEFLLLLGVRKTVSIEFLFTNLDKLKWDDDPKALIDYLRSATLTKQDVEKLRTMQYLPAKDDKARTYAPSELYIGSSELTDLDLPFVRLLKWPSDGRLSADSADGKFLVRLGCRLDPDLVAFLQYLSSQDDMDESKRLQCLNFIAKRLSPGGAYERKWVSSAGLKKMNFLPSSRKDPFGDGACMKELRSPAECFSDPTSQCMGFVILDPDVDRKSGRTYGSRFQLPSKPPPNALIKRLLELSRSAQMLLEYEYASKDAYSSASASIETMYGQVLSYLSSRSNDFTSSQMSALKDHAFIPCKARDGSLSFYRPHEVYFVPSGKEEGDDDDAVSMLFHVVPFSPFLAAAGVRSEASVQDILQILVSQPNETLEKIGVEKYLGLLRRIASDAPFKNASKVLRASPFLIAYENESNDDSEAAARPTLARAHEIHLIDNQMFGRMFPVLTAPHETDLEAFYAKIGSQYISDSVEKTYRITGSQLTDTPLTREFARRLKERKGLLVSQKNTSRPLVDNAAKLVDDRSMQIIQVENIQAIYSLGPHDKFQTITCCTHRTGRWSTTLCITEALDWFDVGSAIGGLILQRCELEDAFLLSNLLEAPLDTLRQRGFAVDRKVEVKKSKPPPKEPSQPPTGEGSKPSATHDPISASASNQEHVQGPTIADLPDKPATNGQHASSATDTISTAGSEASSIDESSPPSNDQGMDSLQKKKRRGLNKGLNKLLRGNRALQNAAMAAAANAANHANHVPPSQVSSQPNNNDKPVSNESDNLSNDVLRGMLSNAIAASRGAKATPVNSTERIKTAVPEDLDRDHDGCEVIPAHQLKMFGKTRNGIKVYSSLKTGAESEEILRSSVAAINAFASVLETLCEIFSLKIDGIAIFNEHYGTTIAFNSNSALYFNFRFFSHLHFNPNGPVNSECYSYWFTTMAHELAHNLVSDHNKDHGYYTESYITLFLPALSAKLSSIGVV